jgi:hypothetical protein
METERAYLVQIGESWIDLSRVEYLAAPEVYLGHENTTKIVMAGGAEIWVNAHFRQELIDKLASFGMLAS